MGGGPSWAGQGEGVPDRKVCSARGINPPRIFVHFQPQPRTFKTGSLARALWQYMVIEIIVKLYT